MWYWRQETITRKADVQRIAINAAECELDMQWFRDTRDTEDEAKFAYDYHVNQVAKIRQEAEAF